MTIEAVLIKGHINERSLVKTYFLHDHDESQFEPGGVSGKLATINRTEISCFDVHSGSTLAQEALYPSHTSVIRSPYDGWLCALGRKKNPPKSWALKTSVALTNVAITKGRSFPKPNIGLPDVEAHKPAS